MIIISDVLVALGLSAVIILVFAIIIRINRKKKVEDEASSTYTTRFQCSNCGKAGTIEIAKGTLFIDASCPKCGCKTIKSYWGYKFREMRE